MMAAGLFSWPVGEAESDSGCTPADTDSAGCGPVDSDNGDSSAPDADNPRVAFVDAASLSPSCFGLTFSKSIDAEALISSGTIASAISLVHLADGPVPLANDQFHYDAASHTVMVRLDSPLSDGVYELMIDSTGVTDLEDRPLAGGSCGLQTAPPEFGSEIVLQTTTGDLRVDSYSVPTTWDWNQDGLQDLIVGEQTASGEGRVRVYLNSGTAESPQFDQSSYVQTANGDLSLPAAGCMGVFPRVADWDADGLPDLVLGTAAGQIHVARNNGTATAPVFASPVAVSAGPSDSLSPIDVGLRATLDVADWNADGLDDLVLGDLEGTIRLLLNQAEEGTPELAEAAFVQEHGADLVVPSGRSSVVVEDLNGDGRKDLVVGNTLGQVLFYANHGTDSEPVFAGYEPLTSDGVEIDLPGWPRSRPDVIDWNGDGTLDLLVGAADGLVRLYSASPAESVWKDVSQANGQAGDPFSFKFQVDAAAPVSPWQSPEHPLDVTGDGYITPLDVLVVANYLASQGAGPVSSGPADPNAPVMNSDCSGDRTITALDAMMIVHRLNTSGICPVSEIIAAEGEPADAIQPEDDEQTWGIEAR